MWNGQFAEGLHRNVDNGLTVESADVSEWELSRIQFQSFQYLCTAAKYVSKFTVGQQLSELSRTSQKRSFEHASFVLSAANTQLNELTKESP